MVSRIARSRVKSTVFMVIEMAVFSAIGAFAPLAVPSMNALMKAVFQWIALPALGALTAGLMSRSGVSHYISWFGPPLIVSALPWLMIGYPLAPGIMLLTCLASMIGASTGDVLRRRSLDKSDD